MTDDVPILIETLSRPFFPMVRCFYLAVEFDIPDNGWMLGIDGRSLPLLMLGLTGVVQTSFGGEPFHEFSTIEQFISSIEKANGLVNFEDIWLPQELFQRKTAVGDVYRVGTTLFREVFRFRDSRMSEERFRSIALEFRNQVEFSPPETDAFRTWSSGTIERIAHEGPKDERLRLERKADL